MHLQYQTLRLDRKVVDSDCIIIRTNIADRIGVEAICRPAVFLAIVIEEAGY